jgi:hypothetical protein
MVNYVEPNRRAMSLDQAMDLVTSQISQSNRYLREDRGSRYNGRLGGQAAMATFLTGRNSLGKMERVWLIVRAAGDGLMYLAFVAPDNEFEQYEPTFRSMVRSFAVGNRW